VAFDYFLKIDGIEGGSIDAEHRGEIEVESFSFAVTNAGRLGSSGGSLAGKATLEDLSVVTRVSSASPQLFLACASGQHLTSALLTARTSCGEMQHDLMRFTLEDILVSGYQAGGGASADVPIDQISLNYAKIKVEFQAHNADGSPGAVSAAGWDMQKNARF
jgi:type VI secretion system secreted protein Hcp